MNIEIQTKRNLLNSIFDRFGVKTDTWGTGSAKTLDDLVAEIDARETRLTAENGKLVRHTAILCIDVHYGNQKLREDRQEFADGRMRRRPYLCGSMAEKLSVDEELDERAIARAVSEELGIPSKGIASLHFGPTWTEETDSPSYPGLCTCFTYHKIRIEIAIEFFRPEGYVEVQPSKRTFFVWV